MSSRSAWRIASHGRQKSKWYLSFQQLMAASTDVEPVYDDEPEEVGDAPEADALDQHRSVPRDDEADNRR